jgi:hypothetical protein
MATSDLVAQYRATGEGREEIINHLKGLAHSYAFRSGYKDDELVGELLLMLVTAVNKAKDALHDNNIERYVLAHFRFGLQKFREKRRVIRVPKSACKKIDFVYQSLMDHHVSGTDADTLELKEMMERFCLDELDTQILSLLLKAHTRQEIADIVGIPKRDVRTRIEEMRARHYGMDDSARQGKPSEPGEVLSEGV